MEGMAGRGRGARGAGADVQIGGGSGLDQDGGGEREETPETFVRLGGRAWGIAWR